MDVLGYQANSALQLEALNDINSNLTKIYDRLHDLRVSSFVNVRVMDSLGATPVEADAVTGLTVKAYLAGGRLPVTLDGETVHTSVDNVPSVNIASFPSSDALPVSIVGTPNVNVATIVPITIGGLPLPIEGHVVVDSGNVAVSNVPLPVEGHVVVDSLPDIGVRNYGMNAWDGAWQPILCLPVDKTMYIQGNIRKNSNIPGLVHFAASGGILNSEETRVIAVNNTLPLSDLFGTITHPSA